MEGEWYEESIELNTYSVTLTTKEVMQGYDAVFTCTVDGSIDDMAFKWSHIQPDGGFIMFLSAEGSPASWVSLNRIQTNKTCIR